MGRELKRKEAKREGKSIKEVNTNKEKPMTPKGLVVALVVVIVLFGLTYLLTGIFATKDIKLFSTKKESEEVSNTIYNRILASETLNQKENNYYVYYYDTTKEDSEITDVIYSLTESVYRVDLNDDFNANFVGEPSGKVSSIENLKVSNPTLVKVSEGEIIEYYSGDEIKSLSN